MASEDATTTEPTVDVPPKAETEEATAATEETAKASPETIKAVAERLKFFFSDANVRQDLFIRKLLLKADGKYPRQVPIEVLLRFNTIKQHSEDGAVVAEAAKTLSDRLVVSEDGTAIGRVVPFRADQMDDNIPLTLYVTNLPYGAADGKGKLDQYSVTTEDVRALFAEYGEVALVKFRFGRSPAKAGEEDGGDLDGDLNDTGSPKKRARHPLGVALVEFGNVEALEKAAADVLCKKDGEDVEPKRKLTVGDRDLHVVYLKDYIDARKKRKAVNENGAGSKEKPDSAVKAKKEFTMDWKPGQVIDVKGFPEDCDREAILDATAKGLDITVDEVKARKIFADYSRGQKDGAIRFLEPSDDVKALCDKLASGELEVAGAKIESAAILEGEAEETYWKNFIEFKNQQFRNREMERGHRKKRARRS